jgi:phenylacetate-CoA ligase
MTDDWVEVLARAGVTSGDRVFVAFSFGPFLGFWLAFEAAQRIGALVFPGGGMSSALRARVIAENRCTVLCCTPTYALHLAEASREAGIDPATTAIRRVVVAGEPGGSLPAVRDRISAAWNGSRVSDHHGMTETGPVTYEDPARPGALVMLENSFLAEVIDPHTLRPVDDGHRGELVLTTLRRTASPLIRYRTGDLVAARGTDGRLILEGGILGRVDDMLVVRGVNVYPAAVDEIVRSVAGTAEYRVTVDRRPALAALEIEIEGDATAANRLAGRLKEDLALRIPVTAVPLGALPRFELKAKRWRSSTGA